MFNELIFILHVAAICTALLLALRLGKEALVGFICLQYILANLFVLKQTTLFGLCVTPSDPFAIGAMLGLNCMQEFYGAPMTRKTITIGFFLLVFYTIATFIHLHYIPDSSDSMQPHFHALLSCMPRITLASLLVYYVVQNLDAWIFRKLKQHAMFLSLTLRSTISIGISQLIDTLLFTFIGLYGLIAHPWHVIGISYAVKMMTLLLTMPFIGLSKRVVKSDF